MITYDDTNDQLDEVDETKSYNRPKRLSKLNWGDKHEQAVADYNKETDPIIKDRIFTENLYEIIYNIASIIIFKYRKCEMPESCTYELVTHLQQSLKFVDQSKGRAFSYLQKCAINWVGQYNVKYHKNNNLHTSIFTENDEGNPMLDCLMDNRNDKRLNEQLDLILEMTESLYRSDIYRRPKHEGGMGYNGRRKVKLLINSLKKEEYVKVNGSLLRSLSKLTKLRDWAKKNYGDRYYDLIKE